MPGSRKRKLDDHDYHALKKKLKKLVEKRSARSRSRSHGHRRHSRRHRDVSRTSSISRPDRSRSASPRRGRDRERHERDKRSHRSHHKRSRSRSRYSSRDKRTYYDYSSDESEDVSRMSPNDDDTTEQNTTEQVSGNGTNNPMPVGSTTADGNKSTEPPGGPAVSSESAVDTVTAAESQLDSSILEIFGEDPTLTKNYGDEIQKDLAIRLEHTATNGLSSETRKELKEKYLIPSNCKLIDAPGLNPEIKAALTDILHKRDKAIEAKQKQIACSISCISQAITRVISAPEKDTELVKLLMHSVLLLCDNIHSDSVTRRTFVLTSLKKDMKEQLINTKPDNLLFGENLAETLKAAKAINKSGAELKVVAPPPNKANAKKTAPGPSRPVNSRGPPARRPAGPPRTKEPAPPRSQPAKYSRPSQRRHQHSRR